MNRSNFKLYISTVQVTIQTCMMAVSFCSIVSRSRRSSASLQRTAASNSLTVLDDVPDCLLPQSAVAAAVLSSCSDDVCAACGPIVTLTRARFKGGIQPKCATQTNRKTWSTRGPKFSKCGRRVPTLARFAK